MRRLGSILGLLSVFVVGFAGAGDYVRVVMDAPGPSPFSMIRYEITERVPATTAVHRRKLPGHAESLHSLGLLTPDEAGQVFALLRELGATALPDATPRARSSRALTWRVEMLLDGVAHSFEVHDPDNASDRRYARVIDAVRATVRSVADPLPFRNVFYAPRDRGWLNIVSVPAARVWIDGFDTQLETPLYSYEVPSGTHTVRLVGIDGAYERSYEVKVEPDGATNVRVDLR